MKVVVTALSTLALAAGLAGPAIAMGSGNDYQDMQTGVTYTVYQPDNTAGLKQTKFTARTDCPVGLEQPLLATYGKKTGAMFTIEEGDLRKCSDIGNGATVYTFKLRGKTAEVVAYCDPSVITKCTKDDVAKYGGHIEVTLPRSPGLRPTTVWIETVGGKKNLTWQQLVTVARSLNPVGRNVPAPPPAS